MDVSAAYLQAPPIARTFAAIVLLTSLGVHVAGLPGSPFFFHPALLWRFPPQIWRFVTAFLLTGEGLGILFDTYFLYSFLSQLETGHPRLSRKEELAWYLIAVGGLTMTIDYTVGFGFGGYLEALILALVYTATQDKRGMTSSFYFITIPAQWSPYCMIAINLLSRNGVPRMLLQLEGLLAAHMYDFLTRIWPEFSGTGRSLLPTPAFMTRVVNFFRGLPANFRSAAGRPAEGGSFGRSTGVSTGPLPDSWRTRGPGHRLG